MPNDTLFISYSRRDKEFVHRLIDNLEQAGFTIWLDTQNLQPGTASWERAIRDAIRTAAAVVLVASPDALHSDYVQGELSLAQLQKRPIFPIWANGEDWINCVPLNMANYQYIDARNEYYTENIQSFIDTLWSAIRGGTFAISLPDHETITVTIEQYPRFDHLLNKYWIFHISPWYEAFTYGTDWVLGNVETKQLALPDEWMSLDITASMHANNENWGAFPLKDFGILPDSHWGVWDFKKFDAVGVAVNDRQLYELLSSNQSLQVLYESYREGILKVHKVSNINYDNYKYRLVIGLAGTFGDISQVIVKTYDDGTAIDWKNLSDKLVFVDDGK